MLGLKYKGIAQMNRQLRQVLWLLMSLSLVDNEVGTWLSPSTICNGALYSAQYAQLVIHNHDNTRISQTSPSTLAKEAATPHLYLARPELAVHRLVIIVDCRRGARCSIP